MSGSNDKPWHKWYCSSTWTNIRKLIFHRDPICMICHRAPSTEVDHKIPHKGVWQLFSDPSNLQVTCHNCHSSKTSREDGGFGKKPQGGPSGGTGPAPTVEPGKQFVATGVGDAALDKALDAED